MPRVLSGWFLTVGVAVERMIGTAGSSSDSSTGSGTSGGSR